MQSLEVVSFWCLLVHVSTTKLWKEFVNWSTEAGGGHDGTRLAELLPLRTDFPDRWLRKIGKRCIRSQHGHKPVRCGLKSSAFTYRLYKNIGHAWFGDVHSKRAGDRSGSSHQRAASEDSVSDNYEENENESMKGLTGGSVNWIKIQLTSFLKFESFLPDDSRQKVLTDRPLM